MGSTHDTEATPLQDQSRRVPGQRRSRERVERVLDAAAALIESDGIDAITMSKLADAADVSLPSIYRYFPSKRAILATLLQRYSDEMRAQVIEPPERPLDLDELPDVIRATVERFVTYLRDTPAYSAVWAAGFADPEIAQSIVESARLTSLELREQVSVNVEPLPSDELALFMATFLTATMSRVAVTMDEPLGDQVMEMMITRVVPSLLGIDERRPV